MPSPASDLLTRLLKDVSRSFYLTLRIMPGAVRGPIGLGYLLARTTDTVADTGVLPPGRRLDALRQLRERIRGATTRPLDFGEFARCQSQEAERLLLVRVEETLSALAGCAEEDRLLVREVLETITGGQLLDLERFLQAGPEHLVALPSDAELDDYTYRVAGCVGEFWTRICRARLFPDAPLDDRFLMENGVRFGRGLQLVNILRDLPADLRQGRCYLPADRLRHVDLRPVDLLNPASEARLWPVYSAYLACATDHLRAGWEYTNHLPRSQRRVRLACAWPILIGVRTIAHLKSGHVLSPQGRIRATRAEVRGILLRSVVFLPWPGAWRRLFERESGRPRLGA